MSSNESVSCPICCKLFLQQDIEEHANRCIFLNCPDDSQKRKRSPSPVLITQTKSPRCTTKLGKDSEKTKIAPMFFSQKEDPSTSSGLKQNTEENNQIKPNTDVSSSKSMNFNIPLAKQVQPKSLDDFFGQNHILGKNTVLRSLLEKGEIPNMILWGPPGCGKTSLSSVVNEICKKDPKKLKFVSLCAATAGVKDVHNVMTIARNDMKFGKRTVLFMDEIHRFNKKQQDVFLLSVEKGELILIGATTENPSFSINSALLSRCRVIVLEKLNSDDMYCILERAAEIMDIDIIDLDNPCGVLEDDSRLGIESPALKWLADISDGDARIALSNLQLALQYFNEKKGNTISICDIKDQIKKSHMLYDRVGEEHYNTISAMHKSIRGSDDNAALYWTTRMIVSGEDPLYIARRLVRAASEDIGNADPAALPLAVATMQGCQLLGMPECDVLLAQCAIYLARAPKSREADSALAKAKRVISGWRGVQPPVPMHLRNAPTSLMKKLDYGQLQEGEEFTFMPAELKNVNFFE